MSKMGLPAALAVKGMVKKSKKLNQGGQVVAGMDDDNSPVSIAEEIRRKQKAPENDTVDLEMNDDEDLPFDFDEQNEEAVGDVYDDDQLEKQPRDSNLKGESVADKIRRKRK